MAVEDETTVLIHAHDAMSLSEDSEPQGSQSTITKLPNEMLINIFRYLDRPPPSANQEFLYDEPGFDATRSPKQDLKNATLVSKRWRQAALPVLFRHAQLRTPAAESKPGAASLELTRFLDFLGKGQLGKVVSTFSLCCENRAFKNHYSKRSVDSFQTLWTSLFRVMDPEIILIIAPAESLSYVTACPIFTDEIWCFDAPCHYLRFERTAPPLGNGDSISSGGDHVLDETAKAEAAATSSSTLPYPADLVRIDPTIADPTTGGSTPSGFENPEHGTEKLRGTKFYADAPVLFSKPWSKLLLNEGSFVRAYATYEFWERSPPSILNHLLGTEQTRPLFSPTIRDFSYIGIFPMEPHFRHITEACPRVDRLYVQLVPRNDILQASSRMTQVEQTDLWLERNRCYAILMRELFNAPPVGNFKLLKCFESGDAADRAAWEMAVEFVKRAGNGWRATTEGVFVKDPKDLPGESEAADEAEGNAL